MGRVPYNIQLLGGMIASQSHQSLPPSLYPLYYCRTRCASLGYVGEVTMLSTLALMGSVTPLGGTYAVLSMRTEPT